MMNVCEQHTAIQQNPKEVPIATPLWAEARFMSRCTHPGCNTPIRKGLKKCSKHLKSRRKATVGRPVTKGSNARGIAAHKPDRSHTRKAKRQNTDVMGAQPNKVRAVRMNPARANATKKDRELF